MNFMHIVDLAGYDHRSRVKTATVRSRCTRASLESPAPARKIRPCSLATPAAWVMPAAARWCSITRPSCARSATLVTVPMPALARPRPDITSARASRDTETGRGNPGTVEDDQERIRNGDGPHATTAGPPADFWPRTAPTRLFFATPAKTVSRSRSPRTRLNSKAMGRRSCRLGWSTRLAITPAIPRSAALPHGDRRAWARTGTIATARPGSPDAAR